MDSRKVSFECFFGCLSLIRSLPSIFTRCECLCMRVRTMWRRIERSEWVTGAYELLFMFSLHYEDYGNLFAYELLDPNRRSVHRILSPSLASCYFVYALSLTLCRPVLVRTVVFLRESVRPAMMFRDTQIKKVAERKKTFLGSTRNIIWLIVVFFSFCFASLALSLAHVLFSSLDCNLRSSARWFSKYNNILIVYLDF